MVHLQEPLLFESKTRLLRHPQISKGRIQLVAGSIRSEKGAREALNPIARLQRVNQLEEDLMHNITLSTIQRLR